MADDGGDPAWAALADVERWAAEVRARDAADARVRERWLRHSAEEEADLATLLLDLAERKAPAAITTSSGRRHTGRVAAVGADFLAVRSDGDRTTFVALEAVAAVRVTGLGPVTGGPAGERGEGRAVAVSVADVLAHAAGRRPRVHVHCDAATVAGELRSVGTDVVTLRTDGDPSGLAYVSLASVSEISLLDSG
ncbi:MAG TPA: hypothetical protein VG455_02005 [Acidimicrobiales bacterium]|nr:hypothetical protein [Acidimicrobiales bacterium]